MIQEWHPTKNGALTPQDVSDSVPEQNSAKYWFQCEVP
jgi:hypothetical protein